MYDIADHPDFHFRTTDIVIRIGNSENERNTECENDVSLKMSFILSVDMLVVFPVALGVFFAGPRCTGALAWLQIHHSY